MEENNMETKVQSTITLHGGLHSFKILIKTLVKAGFTAEQAIVSKEDYNEYPLIIKGNLENHPATINLVAIDMRRSLWVMKQFGFTPDKHDFFANPNDLSQRIFTP